MAKVKKPRLKRDWEGRYVVLRRQLVTKGGAIFEEGDVMRVTRNFAGLHLEAIRACDTCKSLFRHRVKKVPEYDVELLPESYQP